MKLLLNVILFIGALPVFAQHPDSSNIPSNSFENYYRETKPALTYSYNQISQVHNYSNNWDFDKDGINDELYFVGTGGAHLYYFLQVVLTSDKKNREFNFIQSDIPVLTAIDAANIKKTLYGFTVINSGKHLTPTIIVLLDYNTYYASRRKFSRLNIRNNNISVSFENGKAKYGQL